MTKNTEKSEMCEKFQDLFNHYKPGVDFIVLNENEPEVDRETGEPVGNYNLDFKELKEEALRSGPEAKRGLLVGVNGGVVSAFDAATETFIVSARPDIYDTVFGVRNDGLFVPFSQHDTVPADPQKAAAYRYQEAYQMALYYQHDERNLEQLAHFAEEAEVYKLQAMGEQSQADEKKSITETLKSKTFSERFKKAEKFMSAEEERRGIAEMDIQQERRNKAFRRATQEVERRA